MFRRLRAAVAVALAAAGLFFLTLQPYAQNLVEKRVTTRTALAFQSTRLAAAPVAKQNLEELRRYRRSLARDAEYYALVAANHRLLNQAEEAIAAYETAVSIEERPELYLYLGLTELQAGRREAAVAHLARAVRFNSRMIEQIPGEALRAEVLAAAKPRLR